MKIKWHCTNVMLLKARHFPEYVTGHRRSLVVKTDGNDLRWSTGRHCCPPRCEDLKSGARVLPDDDPFFISRIRFEQKTSG